jgi:hypothetical protein
VSHVRARWQPREMLKVAPYTVRRRLLCGHPLCSGELPSFLNAQRGVTYFMLDGWQWSDRGILERGRPLRQRRSRSSTTRRIPPGREVLVSDGLARGKAAMALPALVRCPRCGRINEVDLE